MNQWFEAQSQRVAFLTQTVEARVPVPPALGTALVELFEIHEVPIVEGHVVLSLPEGDSPAHPGK